MIPYKPIQEIALGFIHIKVWGLIVALGILTALTLSLKRAKKIGIKQAYVYDITFYSILAGLIGSRIGYILSDWPAGKPLTFISAVNLTEGGLSFTFGLLAAMTASIAYMKYKKIKMLKFLDFIAPYIALGHAIARIGCFLIGDHIGKVTTFFLGVMINGQIRHNVALYEIIILLAIFAILTYTRRFSPFDGFTFASYLLLYSLLRFPLDFLRNDMTYYGLTAAQYILIALFIISATFLTIKLLKRR